jgi:hypothetical protein
LPVVAAEGRRPTTDEAEEWRSLGRMVRPRGPDLRTVVDPVGRLSPDQCPAMTVVGGVSFPLFTCRPSSPPVTGSNALTQPDEMAWCAGRAGLYPVDHSPVHRAVADLQPDIADSPTSGPGAGHQPAERHEYELPPNMGLTFCCNGRKK